jgi:integrase/recombinase XerD
MKTAKPNRVCNPEVGASDSPLGDYPEKFRSYLEAEHYSKSSIRECARFINDLDRLMKKKKVEIGDLDENHAVDLITSLRVSSSGKKRGRYIAINFVRFLTDSGAGKSVLPPELDETPRGRLRRDYEEYLRCQRGLSERTIRDCWLLAARFLRFRFGDEMGDLSRITLGDIVEFLQQLVSRGKPYRDKTPSTHLRNFFRFLFRSGKTAANLSLCIPSIKQQYSARLPRYLDTEQVESLIRAVRADSPMGRRNHAMVLLLARLGLRAPEVIAMQIDDIDWRAGEILVRGKGQRQDRLPLPQDVGEAIAEYLQRDRVGNSRALFVSCRAPHRPFKDAQILNWTLKAAFAKTGLTPPVPFVGSHVLRHSLAAALARRSASLEEIAEVLRHRSRASTMIYAKLDIEGLRTIAQPWPIAGGAK